MTSVRFCPRLVQGILLLLLSSPCAADDVLDQKLGELDPDEKTRWYDISQLNVEGRGWTPTEAFYNRLPAKAKGVVRDPVWRLSQDSAGMCVRFVTNATVIEARWTLRSETLALPQMPATGASGLDLYVKTENGRWRWLSVGQPKKYPADSVEFVKDIPAGKREYLLYLPLYNGVHSIAQGRSAEQNLGHREGVLPWS